MFGQDGYAVREFRGFNFVYHPLETKGNQIYTVVEKGSWNPSTPQKWRQTGDKPAVFTPIYLTAVQGVAENDGLFVGSGKVSSPEPVWPVHSFQTNLVAEVFA